MVKRLKLCCHFFISSIPYNILCNNVALQRARCKMKWIVKNVLVPDPLGLTWLGLGWRWAGLPWDVASPLASELAAFELNYISATHSHTHARRQSLAVCNFQQMASHMARGGWELRPRLCLCLRHCFCRWSKNHVKCQIGERQENGAFVLSFLLSYHSPYLLF